MQNTLIQHINDVGIAEVWKSILNLVDYVVVAFLIFIAFTNILKIQIDTYAVKKTIPSLVLGVVLANLSWYICIMIVDFATTLVQWERHYMVINMLENTGAQEYIDKYYGTSGISKISSVIDPGAIYEEKGGGFLSLMFLALFKPFIDNLDKADFTNLGAIIGWGTSVYATSLFQILLGALLFLIQFLLLLFTYFMFIVRLIVIDMLIVVSPLAFLAIGFPMTQKFFQQWWSQFARWVFMAPIAFFIWSFGIVITLLLESKTGGLGGSLVTGVIKYVMLGACLYFAIKLPFTLGGGIMNAWGGLGTKIGKHAGKWANDKFYTATKSGRFAGIQFKKPGTGVNVLGMIKGWGEGAEAEHQSKLIEGAGVGRDLREGITGAVPRGWNLLKKAGKGELNEYLKGESIGSSLYKTSGRGKSIAISQDLEKGKVLANSDQNSEQILNHAITAVKEGNYSEARQFMAAAAMRRLDVDKDTKDEFNKMDPAFMRACVQQSRLASTNVNNSGVAWASMSDDIVKAENDLVDSMKVENARTHGAGQQVALNNLKNHSDENQWATEQNAAYKFLAEQAEAGHLKGVQLAAFQTIKGGVNKTIDPKLAKAATDQMNEFAGKDSFADQEAHIKQVVDAQYQIKAGDTSVEAQARAQFLNYVRRNHNYILSKIGNNDPNFSKKLGEALGKIPVKPHLSIAPDINIKPNINVAELYGSPITQGVDANFKNIAESWQGFKNPESIDVKSEADLDVVRHFTNKTNVTTHKEQMKQILSNMAKENDEIGKMFKDEKGEIDVDRALKVNLKQEISQRGGLEGVSLKRVEELGNLHQKLQSVNQSVDAYHEKGLRMQQAENYKNKLIFGA